MIGADVTAIDVTSSRLKVAIYRKSLVENTLRTTVRTKFTYQNVLDLDVQEPFDAIWLEQAFHHCEPRNQVVEKIAKLLKPAGNVFFCEVNPWHPLISLGLFLKRGTKTIKTYVDENGNQRLYGNERIVTKSGLAKCLARVGIVEEDYRYFNIFPNWRMFDGLAEHEEKYPNLPALYSHYNFVGKKI